MGKLYEKCKDIIVKSTSCHDEEIIDYLTISFMALYTLKGYIILDRLPSIIEGLTICKNELNKVDLNIGIVCQDGDIKCQNILSFPDEISNYEYYNVIENTIFYLITLLRIKEIKSNNEFVEIKTGISSKKIGMNGDVTIGRGAFLEKGITNLTVRDSMNSLRKYLSDDYDDGIITDHYAELVKNRLFIYDVRVYLIEKLMECDSFKDLVDQSFINLDDKGFSVGYNAIMDNDCAYTNLNNLFNELSHALVSKNEDEIEKYISLIWDEINGLNKNNKQFKKNSQN